jgi:hypothetical protein
MDCETILVRPFTQQGFQGIARDSKPRGSNQLIPADYVFLFTHSDTSTLMTDELFNRK